MLPKYLQTMILLVCTTKMFTIIPQDIIGFPKLNLREHKIPSFKKDNNFIITHKKF